MSSDTAGPETIDALNARAAIAGTLAFRVGPGGLWFADVHNADATATVCLQGGQVLHWQPRGQAVPVLWLSDTARYVPGTAIRGGIPVCWPWFGAAPAVPAGAAPLPAHGFARTRPWRVAQTRALAGGQTQLCLRLAPTPESLALWPGRFSLELQLTVGAELELTLVTANTGGVPLRISEALHTYFRIGAIDAIGVHGLAQAPYFDAVLGREVAAVAPAGSAQRGDGADDGAIRFAGELDRVYDAGGACRITDPILGRTIELAATGAASTVVWSPGEAKAQRLGDLAAAMPPGPASAGDWRSMVCVESGNARHRAVEVAAGDCHALGVRYRVASDGAGATAHGRPRRELEAE